MSLTDYHAKYLAHELTRRCASDSVEKLARVLADAQVDLNPHQVEAALFAMTNGTLNPENSRLGPEKMPSRFPTVL